MDERAFHEISPWVTTPADLQPSLAGDIRADVVVVGGGFTGLSTALALRERGVDVALVEADYCGMGASGRNAGHLTPTIGKDFPTLVKYFGKPRAAELARFAERAVRNAEALIGRLAIDCEYNPTGNIVGGMHPSHRKPLEMTAELAQTLGLGIGFLDETAIAARRLPGCIRFGLLETCGGHLHPGKLVMGLRSAALAAGVRIFEGSPATAIADRAAPVRVSTASGSVTAEKLVLATNAYTPTSLGLMRNKVFPLRVTLFRTGVLSPEQWERIGWTGREGIYTAHESLENYRPTADGRILGGSKFVQYGFGSTLPSGYRPEVFKAWRATFAARFPELPDLAIESFWGGWIAMTLDYLPFIEQNRRNTVFTAMGYNGHGIAQATYAGSMLADLVMGVTNPEVALLKRRTLPLPPEPLRWGVIRALTSMIHRTDARVDADLAAAQ